MINRQCGPLDLKFDLNSMAAVDLSQSPTEPEKICFRTFIRELKNGAVDCPNYEAANRLLVLAHCDHVWSIKVSFYGGTGVVKRLVRGKITIGA